jgi:putative ABC transport system permease protein
MFEIFRLAFNELYSNKGRTILTSLGIAVGVMAVSLILTAGSIGQQYITNKLTQSIGDPTTVIIQNRTNGDTALLTINDYNFIQTLESKYPIVSFAAIDLYNSIIRDTKDKSIPITVRGATVNYPKLSGNKNLANIEGRFFSKSEEQSGENVAVVTKQFSKEIKGKSTLIGERIQIETQSFLVIGEYEGQSTLFGSSNEVNIPITSLWKLNGVSKKNIGGILYKVNSESDLESTPDKVLNELNKNRLTNFSGDQSKPVSTDTSKSAIETVSGIVTAFQLFLAMVAVVSLVVGGIGVLNVMLMAVAQRIKEIGIRKAFGAKNRDILLLFLSESVTLTALSGLFGALLAQYLAFLGVTLVNNIVPGTDLIFTYSWQSIYIAFILSAAIGISFGIYPAYKAGKLSVVDALRYD